VTPAVWESIKDVPLVKKAAENILIKQNEIPIGASVPGRSHGRVIGIHVYVGDDHAFASDNVRDYYKEKKIPIVFFELDNLMSVVRGYGA
jgi:hypothetical protein